MTCRDFERVWNELIDAEAGGVFERASAARPEARRAGGARASIA